MGIDDLSAAGVVGAGEMGPGIALTLARHGVDVTLVDQSEAALEDARDELEHVTDLLVDRDVATESATGEALDRIRTATELSDLAGVDYVTEAVTEDLDVKREVFADLDEVCDEDVVLASNTSSIDIDDIAAATSRPERVLVTHWMNPPWVVPVVEVVLGDRTSDDTESFVVDLLEDVGRSPVVLNEVVPGYLINRMNFALAREALHLMERGVVEKEDVDTLFTDAFGPRYTLMGPIEMLDLFGHDTNLAISEYLFPDLCDDDEPSSLVEDLVERGDLGMKTGRGFYDYGDERQDVESIDRALLDRYRELGRYE
ncbi:3-hydroxyacyl-CoA dehydrogenase family protein [Halomicrobium urmianum]|uniref:3-hydroxyacyl-CoA dehydrogenase family protein n=1 Tax=Halomicrobium urmianum TaxID=1586233 RepID=UPI001CD9BFBD|nr:3-hydroxyacyl-CoA dehydrogenase family protein [Halomicrobium urmianum]